MYAVNDVDEADNVLQAKPSDQDKAKAKPYDSREYKGCYADKFGDRVMSDKVSAKDMTPEKCRSHCAGKGKRIYYGTQVQYGSCSWKQRSR